jgi:hypothetical protein
MNSAQNAAMIVALGSKLPISIYPSVIVRSNRSIDVGRALKSISGAWKFGKPGNFGQSLIALTRAGASMINGQLAVDNHELHP